MERSSSCSTRIKVECRARSTRHGNTSSTHQIFASLHCSSAVSRPPFPVLRPSFEAYHKIRKIPTKNDTKVPANMLKRLSAHHRKGPLRRDGTPSLATFLPRFPANRPLLQLLPAPIRSSIFSSLRPTFFDLHPLGTGSIRRVSSPHQPAPVSQQAPTQHTHTNHIDPLLELGTDSYTEVVPAPQGGRLW
jgi:hypothetical protein